MYLKTVVILDCENLIAATITKHTDNTFTATVASRLSGETARFTYQHELTMYNPTNAQ
jgi:hypothetical protein